jgi:hypothetical protein
MGDLTLNADVVGPFRERERADRMAERIEKAAASMGPMIDGGSHPALVQVVPVVPGARATRDVIAALVGDTDRGEADPGLLVILLGAGLAVLAGGAAIAIATGLLG